MIGARLRRVDVLVGQSDVLENGQEAVLALQVPDQVGDRVQAGERMQRATVMAGREVGGAHDRERRRNALRIDVLESSSPLGFCNRYVSTGSPGDQGLVPPALALGTSDDVSTALSILDSVAFAQLHVTRMTATIDALRS